MATQAQSAVLRQHRKPLYAYWHLLSLDAPTVAALWCYAFSLAAGQPLPVTVPLALGIATWMLYVSDRLLDSRHLLIERKHSLHERHWFHSRHQSSFLPGLFIAAIVLGWLLFTDLPIGLLRADTALAALVAVYFLLIHGVLPTKILAGTQGRSSEASYRSTRSKELAVAAIFAAAVVLPAVRRASHPATLVVPAILFTALCWLNCSAIDRWESPDRSSSRARFSRYASGLLAVAATGCAVATFFTTGSMVELLLSPAFARCLIQLCIAVSSLALLMLDIHRESLSPLVLRVAADAALLTPLLVLPFLR
jgi:hypothetical protein